jgi:hypothetical protein
LQLFDLSIAVEWKSPYMCRLLAALSALYKKGDIVLKGPPQDRLLSKVRVDYIVLFTVHLYDS